MQQFKLNFSPIVYYTSGKGCSEWVLFLHAAFVNHKMFQPQIKYFENKYNILVVDIIGHGKSTDTKKGDCIEKMSAWIYDIMNAEKIKKIHIVGISLGAVLAQDFANRYPEAVNSLACFGGYDINNFDKKMQKENGTSQIRMMLKAFVSIKWFAKANKKISAYTSDAQTAFYNMNIQFKKKSFMYMSGLQKLINKYPRKQRQYKLLVGCGEHDMPMEIEIVNEWSQYENCERIILKGAGHCANMDSPQEFNLCLENFLQKCHSESE